MPFGHPREIGYYLPQELTVSQEQLRHAFESETPRYERQL